MVSVWPSRSLLCATVAIAVVRVMAASSPDFPTEVRPILAEHCFECHGTDKAKGGLNLTTYRTATSKLKSGAVAVASGRPEASELIRRIEASDPDERMPPPAKQPLQP